MAQPQAPRALVHFLYVFMAWLPLALLPHLGGADTLPSWTEGRAKERIETFVAQVTNPSLDTYVPASDRIAIFDNDGTLMVERPDYAHLAFLKSIQSDKETSSYVAGSWRYLERLFYGEFASLIRLQAGMSAEQYEAKVKTWLATATHQRFRQRYEACIYTPMLELIDLLRKNEFSVYLCSGSDRDFLRGFAPALFNISPNHVLGSNPSWTVRQAGGTLVLVRGKKTAFVNISENKAVSIHDEIGKTPLFVAGNSDGDLEMLLLSATRRGPSLQLLVNHDDADREYAYSEGAVAAMRTAEAHEWEIVNMKRDWRVVFPFSER